MLDIDCFIEKYLKELSAAYKNFDKDKEIINKACDMAKLAHEGIFRKHSGKPYIVHPLRVAIMVAKKCDNLPLILAAILHDTVEDSPDKISMKNIYEEFGEEVGYLVDAVTNNIPYFYHTPDLKFKDKLDKLLTGMMKDARCGILKLFDRQHNNKTLEGLKIDKQIRKSFETQALYNPLGKILRVDEPDFVLNDVCKLVDVYLRENNIHNVDELKSSLYNMTFEDIDSESFEAFYYVSDSIVWELEDKELLKSLMEYESFDENIEIVSITYDAKDNFSCLFKYKKGQIFDSDFKASVSSFSK